MIRGEIGSSSIIATFTPKKRGIFKFYGRAVMDKPFLAKARGTVCDFLVSMRVGK